jgi:hypothetical protein
MKRISALLLALALALAACGGDDAGGGGASADSDVVDDLTQEILEGSGAGSDTPFTDEQAACFALGLVDEFGAETMVEALQMEFEEFMAAASPGERAVVVDTMLDCVDFGALMAAELGDAISAESASCIGDAFTNSDAFREALANSFDESGGDPFEDDAMFAEVFPAMLECLSAEELANLGGLEG